MSAPLGQRHVDILAGDVLEGRVVRFVEDQRIAAVGHNRAPIETTMRVGLRSIVMG